MEEANRKESELRERLEAAEASTASATETLTARVAEAEAALKESEEKRLAVSDTVQGHSAQLDKATEYHTKHLNISLELGDRAEEGRALSNLVSMVRAKLITRKK